MVLCGVLHYQCLSQKGIKLIFPLGVFAFFDIIGTVFVRAVGGFFLLFVIGPAAIILLGYLIYIVVMTIKELRK